VKAPAFPPARFRPVGRDPQVPAVSKKKPSTRAKNNETAEQVIRGAGDRPDSSGLYHLKKPPSGGFVKWWAILDLNQ